jgi:hypothetical protein
VQHAEPGLPQLVPPSKPPVLVMLQLLMPWAALSQLASTALSVALVSVVPALVHLTFAAAQFSTAW